MVLFSSDTPLLVSGEPFVNYRIQVIRQGEVIATLDVAEHPAEDYLDSLVATYAADFCDVCRLEPCEVE